jgi:hypothetical protein
MPRTEDIDETLTVYVGAEAAFVSVVAAFRQVGSVKSEDARFRRVVGKIKSGAAGMNAATVTVSVDMIGPLESRIKINASAQEGMVKQHTAPRAVARLLAAVPPNELPTSPPPATTPPLGGGGDPLGQLERLAALRDSGVITDADYEAKKADLLGRI